VSVVVSGLKEPALVFVTPEDSEGENGSEEPGHGEPFGPEVIGKLEVGLTAGVAEDGVNVAVVV